MEKTLQNPEDQKRALELFKNVRCITCDGQSIKESGARVAQIMRVDIRNKIINGSTNEEILTHIKEKYSKDAVFVSKSDEATFPIWILPIIIFIIGLGYIIKKAKK